jgi:hypothetical protein
VDPDGWACTEVDETHFETFCSLHLPALGCEAKSPLHADTPVETGLTPTVRTTVRRPRSTTQSGDNDRMVSQSDPGNLLGMDCRRGAGCLSSGKQTDC